MKNREKPQYQLKHLVLGAVLLFGLVALSAIQSPSFADEEPKGPFQTQAEALKLEADRILKAPFETEWFLERASDTKIPHQDQRLALLEQKLSAFKKEIYTQSVTLDGIDVSVSATQDLKSASFIYFLIQKRLLLNYLRNAHSDFMAQKHAPTPRRSPDDWVDHLVQIQSPVYTAQRYDYLDLEFSKPFGIELASDNSLGLLYNVRHQTQRSNHHLNDPSTPIMTLSMSKLDKIITEQEAIASEPSLDNFGKSVLFNTLVSRIQNHWALDRITRGERTFPNLGTCGEQFYTIKTEDTHQGDYFEALQRIDYIERYQKGTARMLLQLRDAKLANSDDIRTLLRQQIQLYPGTLALRSSNSAAWENYYQELGPKLAEISLWGAENDLPKTQNQDPDQPQTELVENSSRPWTDQAIKNALASAFFHGDEWNPELVASRISDMVVSHQKNSLVTFLAQQAITQGIQELMVESTSTTKPVDDELSIEIDFSKLDHLAIPEGQSIADAVQDVANSLNPANTSAQNISTAKVKVKSKKSVQDAEVLVNTLLKDRVSQFKSEIQSKLTTYLSSRNFELLGEIRKIDRRKEKYAEVEKQIIQASHAYGVYQNTLKIQKPIREHYKNWMKTQSASDKKYYLRDVELFSLPSIKYMVDRSYVTEPKQLEFLFYKKLYHWAKLNSHIPSPRKVSLEILTNKLVMNAVTDFLAELTQEFYQALKQQQLKAVDITTENSPLYSLLIPLAKKHQQKLNDTMLGVKSNDEKPSPYPALNSKNQSPFAAPIDQLKLLSGPTEISTVVSDAKRREHTQGLFIQAMSVFGIGKELGADYAQIKRANIYKGVRSVYSPLEIEKINRTAASGGPLYLHLAASLYDQKILSESIFQLIEQQNPILAIEVKDSDGQAISVLKKIIKNDYALDQALVQFQTQEDRTAQMQKLQKILSIPNNTQPQLLPKIKSDSEATKLIQSFKTKQQIFNEAISTATLNNKNLVEEACRAKTYEVSDSSPFRMIFRTATNLRDLLITAHPKFKEYDDTWMSRTRTRRQKQYDAFEPYVHAAGLILLLAMPYFIAPAIAPARALYSATRSINLSFRLAAEQLSVRGGGAFRSVLTKLMSNKFMIAFELGFVAQARYLHQISHIDLPAQLAYQTRLSNSYIGFLDGAGTTREQVKNFTNEVSAKKTESRITTFITAAMVTPFWIMRLGRFYARAARNGLSRMATAETQGLVNTSKELTYTQSVQKLGFVKGTQYYIARSASAFKNGVMPAMRSSTTFKDLITVQSHKMASVTSADALISDLQLAIRNRLDIIKPLRDELKNMAKANPEILRLGTDNSIQITKNAVNSAKSQNLVNGMKDGSIWRMVIADSEEEMLQSGKFLASAHTTEETAAVLKYGIYMKLNQEGKFLADQLKFLQSELKTLKEQLIEHSVDMRINLGKKGTELSDHMLDIKNMANKAIVQKFYLQIEDLEQWQLMEQVFKEGFRKARGSSFPVTQVTRMRNPQYEYYWRIRDAFKDFNQVSMNLRQTNPEAFMEYYARKHVEKVQDMAKRAEAEDYKGEFYPDESWIKTFLIHNQQIQCVHGIPPLRPDERVFTIDITDFKIVE